MIAPLPDLLIDPVVRAALAEDLGRAGDITAMACIEAEARLEAVFAVRGRGVTAGRACARLAVMAMDPDARFETLADCGHQIMLEQPARTNALVGDFIGL